ncbi:hypothetical protein AM493_01595 [Flavobacterium akiainvivens]|uniref:DUF4834 domain-containing protein n=1 Tax=Flavobacterium akiainvivens TaxID=1202724 RepID=A0A0M8MG38_9FLAO|nr:DUF4834 family protein [Flavobacterium akiainvivens]KOS04878.1 hypothetical protein AM493_01595 [Flavobacterium akiainvivens]SFQ42831.1 protein of unknown function [Flavobacterium akiainvivens]
METASFNGLLKTIFIIVLVYYAIRFLMRLLAPVIVQEVVKKAEQNFQRAHNQQQSQQQQYGYDNNAYQQPKPEKPREKKKVGEYIDFEEIE